MKLLQWFGFLAVMVGVLLLSGCARLPDEAHEKVVTAIIEDHDLNFSDIVSVKRVWRPGRIFEENIDRLWCVVATGGWDEGNYDVPLWVIEINSTYVVKSASEEGFEKAGCKK